MHAQQQYMRISIFLHPYQHLIVLPAFQAFNYWTVKWRLFLLLHLSLIVMCVYMHVSLPKKLPIHILCPLSYCSPPFNFLILYSPLYILNIAHGLLNTIIIFSPFVNFSVVPSIEQKSFILMYSKCINFFFIVCALQISQNKSLSTIRLQIYIFLYFLLLTLYFHP